jgi:arabinose-5-phosphate isomerase
MSEPSVIARQVFEIESAAIAALAHRLDARFEQAVALMYRCAGRLVVTGMGKSGLIARKIAATLSSTGSPAMFLHPAEAIHGDLGMVMAGDVVLALSNSGETDEIIRLIPFLEAHQIPLLALVGRLPSTLSAHAAVTLDVSVEKEACPLQLAPTASAVAALAMGDALAMALMDKKSFQPEQFAAFHPGGALGKRLVTRVKQVMRTHDLPVLSGAASAVEVIHAISAGRLGLVVVESGQEIAGIVTDGDVRRAMVSRQAEFFSLQAADLMSPNPVIISPELRLHEAELTMRARKITSLLVAGEDKRLAGVIQIYDLSI